MRGRSIRKGTARARWALALLLAGGLIGGCGTSKDRDDARAAAEGVYAAVQARNGEQACRGLTTALRGEIESQESKRCAEAILGLELEGSRGGTVEVYVDEALVELSGGDSVFLEETRQGWRVSALGCQGQAPDQPAQCEGQA